MSRIAFAAAVVWTALSGCTNDPAPVADASTAPLIDAPDIDATDGGSTCGGTLDYLAPCANDNECFSCACEIFVHDRICTKSCTSDNDCPAPSQGCDLGRSLCRPAGA